MDIVEGAGAAAYNVEIEDGPLVADGQVAFGCCDMGRMSWQSSDAQTWVSRPRPPELDGRLFTGARRAHSRTTSSRTTPNPIPTADNHPL